MHYKKLCVIFIPCLLLHFNTNSQTVIAGSEIREGLPIPAMLNTGYQDNEFIRQQGLINGTIYLDDESAIFQTTTGLTRVNKNMEVLWKNSSNGYIQSLSKLGNQLLAISTKSKGGQKDNSSVVTAKLIDVATGNAIKQNIVYENNTPYSIDQNVCVDVYGNFKCLILRKSNLAVTSEKPEIYARLVSGTSEILFIKLDNDLNIINQQRVESKLNKENVMYAGCTSDKKGNLFLFGYESDKLFCERIKDGEFKSNVVLETNIDIGKYGINSTIITTNEENNDDAAIVLKYKNSKKDFEVLTARFDFTTGKAKADVLSLDKKLVRSIGPAFTYRFELIGLVSYKNKLCTLLEFQSGDGSKIYTGAIVARVFDEEMGLTKMITIDKDYERFSPICPVAGYKVLNDRLILLANTNKGAASLFPWYTEINLNTLEVKKPVSIPKKYVNDGVAIEGPATLWFGNTAILQYYTGQMRAHKIIMQKVEF